MLDTEITEKAIVKGTASAVVKIPPMKYKWREDEDCYNGARSGSCLYSLLIVHLF